MFAFIKELAKELWYQLMNEDEERRCEVCGLRKEGVETTIDPYREKVYAERCWVTACKGCLQARGEKT